MYWIYLILFTGIVFVPMTVHNITLGLFGFSIDQTEEFLILILGSLGFAIFLFQEKKLKKNQKERTKIQSQVNRMSKDLTHSYSYIGEINRKLDILENISNEFPDSANPSVKKRKEAFESIIEAIELFGKANEFVIRFISQESNEMLKEFKSDPHVAIHFPLKKYESEINLLENEEFLVIRSPKTIDGVFACIIIKKKNAQHSIDDPEIMKTLASQALLLFMFIQSSEKKRKS